MIDIEETIGSMALMTIRQRHPTGAVDRVEINKAILDCARLFSEFWIQHK
jgi:hypothetical protein